MIRTVALTLALLALVALAIFNARQPVTSATERTPERAANASSEDGLDPEQVRIELGRLAEQDGMQLNDQLIGADADSGRVFHLQEGGRQDRAEWVAVSVHPAQRKFMAKLDEGAPTSDSPGRICNATIDTGRWDRPTRVDTDLGRRVAEVLDRSCHRSDQLS